MKRCLLCGAKHSTSLPSCPNCGARPEVMEGFVSYAPELALEGGGFNSNYFGILANFEDKNFWFRSRNKLIVWALGKYNVSFRSFLEIGCGTGYVLSGISNAFPGRELFGSEIFTTGLSFAAERLASSQLMQMDARAIPFADEFDVIGAFDVLEHIEEDDEVLAQIHRALSPGGVVLVTVPQHQWLWSKFDEDDHHVRRYSAKELQKKLETVRFKILRSTSFVSILLPAMVVSRLFMRKRTVESPDSLNELRISPWLNAIFGYMLGIESWLIRLGINLPIGGSLLVVAMKTVDAKDAQ